jgi:hypothetical protein
MINRTFVLIALATAINRPELLKEVWQAVNQSSDEALMGEGRVYGGGSYKLELKELGNVIA